MYKTSIIGFAPFLFFSFNGYAQFADESRWCTGQSLNGFAENIEIGDFNGDGLDDKVYFSGPDWLVALSNGHLKSGNDGFKSEKNWAKEQKESGRNIKLYVGDFNGDGLDDIVSYNTSSGQWKVSLSKQSLVDFDSYSFSNYITWASTLFTGTTDHYIGDFNGDGISDVACNRGNGVWEISSSNGSTFDDPITWATNQKIGDEYYFGDFNGDGMCDKACFFDDGEWWISLSDGIEFITETSWTNGAGVNSDGRFVGDFNGDRRADILLFGKYCGCWYPLISTVGNYFLVDSSWATEQGDDATVVFVGDFNGDNLCDRASFISGSGQWQVALNKRPQEKIVATWFTAWWYLEHPFWKIRDLNKIPVVGWPNNKPDTGGIYSCQDTQTVDLQIDAMIKAGINLIVVDFTNGGIGDDGNWITPEVLYGVNTLFMVMNNRRLRNQKFIRIAIGLGKEFWGPSVSFPNDLSRFLDWPHQYGRQRRTLDSIKTKYVTAFPEIYFDYLNRPLIVVYLNNGFDYPPNKNGVNIPLWHYNDFTFRKALTWGWTFGNIYNNIFRNGQDTKKYWGWGAEKQQPFNKECMSVMPGTHNYVYYKQTDVLFEINRNQPTSGSYYIDSWKRIIEVNPVISLICDWNNWDEETAIEGCIGTNGWKDLNGIPAFDWYLKITKYYANIFRENVLLPGIYIQQDELPNIYKWNGLKLETFPPDYKPSQEPIIKLPSNWLQNHGYWF